MNADFIINYMDVVPFDLSSIVRPPSPGAPHPPSPPAPRPSPPASPPPPTRPVSPSSPSVSEGYMSTPPSLSPDTNRSVTPSEDTDVGLCSYKSSQSSPDDDSPRDSPSASPPITLSEKEEEEKKKEDLSYDPLDDISVMEEERVSKHGRGVRTQGGVTSPRTLRRKRREEEERQEMELEAMREIPWSISYDDGDNTVSIEVHRPPDDSQVTLPISVDP